MKNKRMVIIVVIFSIIFLSLSGTLAYLSWESDNTLVTFVVDEGFMCSADVGGDITPENVSLAPAVCTSEKNAIKKKLTVYPTVFGDLIVGLDMWLEIDSIAPELSATQNFKYALTTDEYSCTNNVVASGSFTGKQNGDHVELLKQQIYTFETSVAQTYYLYIWLDAEETSLSTANKSFNFILNGTCKDTLEGYNFMVNFDVNGGNGISTTFTTVGESTYTVPEDGTYKLETWGAQGGDSDLILGGYGGYSVGHVNLESGEKLYVNVGGKGSNGLDQTNYTSPGGYNGGGSGIVSGVAFYVSGGGGATHIATVSGELADLSSSLNSILIVSGGGGGVAYNDNYSHTKTHIIGHGGGAVGNTAYGETATSGGYYAYGGTQTGASGTNTVTGGFGYGANGKTSSTAGGGGGFYGGNANNYSAGGGSGYIGNSLLTNKAMYCYECSTSSDASSLTYSITEVSSTPTANYAKSGNGAARISKVDVPSKTVFNGDTYGTLPVLTRDGYEFLGWNTKADGTGEMVTSASVVNLTSEQMLYAIWKKNLDAYTIVYDANGGSGEPSEQIKNHDVELTLSSIIPTRTGYTFNGWNTKSDGTGTSYSAGGSYTLNAEQTLYAMWEIDNCHITVHHYYFVGGASSSTRFASTPQDVNYNTTFIPSEYVTTPPEGYYASYFKYYYSYSDGSYKYIGEKNLSDGSFVVTQNMIVNIYYLPNTYTITYDSNGGTGAPSSQTKTHDADLTLSTTIPTKTGHTFQSWNTKSDGTGTSYSAGGSYTANAGATLYAIWKANTYTIKYNVLYGLTNVSSTNSDYMTYSVSNGVVTVTSNRNDGYGFTNGRVYLEAGVQYTFSASTSCGTWGGNGTEENPYNTVEAFLVLDGTYTTFIQITSNNNYKFTPTVSGTYWLRLDVNMSGKTHTFSNIIIYPSTLAPQTKTYGVTLTLSNTIPKRSGYTFKGWSTTMNATSASYSAGGSYTVNSDTTLYAVW